MTRKHSSKIGGFRRGQMVRIASREEILATLDDDGSLDGMPLMPQMLEMCGTAHIISNRADKSCDTINGTGGLRLYDTVHLQGVRCDGAAYGGCQAGCLIFWKESWLRPVDEPETSPDASVDASSDDVMKATRRKRSGSGPEIYRCQATELTRASEPLKWYDIRQYWRDWRYNEVSLGRIVRAFAFWLFRQSLKIGAYNIQVRLFNSWQRMRGGPPFPFQQGKRTKTPAESLDLEPGELVRVKSYEDILATLDSRNRNRGLFFDAEMVKFCGGTYRVAERVTRIINEQSGEMLEFGSPGIILENVFCTSSVSRHRLFCPRAIHHYWREIWLTRLADPDAGESDQSSGKAPAAALD